MSIEEFLALMDFIIAQAMNVFTVLDAAVIVDSPRFTMFSLILSILFLTLVLSFINWLRGTPGVIFNNRRYDDEATDRHISESVDAVNANMSAWRNEENRRFLKEYTNMTGKPREVYREK